jgi:hypothetical protein
VSDDLDALRAKIALMREMGVLEADGIKLGAPPVAPKAEETPKEMLERANREAQRRHDIMFAHSTTKPRLRGTTK